MIILEPVTIGSEMILGTDALMVTVLHRIVLLTLMTMSAACSSSGEVTVRYREIDHTFSWSERRTIQRIADNAVEEGS